jgi:hypothetical protein
MIKVWTHRLRRNGEQAQKMDIPITFAQWHDRLCLREFESGSSFEAILETTEI